MAPPGAPFLISTVISGPERFRFVGFWAMTEKHAGYSYPRQATRLIEALLDDGLPTVVAGDFNAPKGHQHLGNVQRPRARGLVSAYHAFHGIEHSAVEADPTSYFQWQESRPPTARSARSRLTASAWWTTPGSKPTEMGRGSPLASRSAGPTRQR